MSMVPACRTVTIHAFRGNRSVLGKGIRKKLDDEMNGRGPGPSMLECLLYAGHAGVSTYSDKTIHGFNPNVGSLPISLAMQKLRNGDAFPGIVHDDTQVFTAAKKQRLKVLSFDLILPDPSFQDFESRLRDERRRSRFTYGFPNGDGDCNCTTWLERLALPLLAGSMDEFTGLSGFFNYPTRRFGQCV